MNKYRSHNCNQLRKNEVGKKVILSGWINKKRDHGNLLFIDLRDNYGVTQCIINQDNPNFSLLEKTQLETVIQIEGKVVNRSSETINKEIATGEVEIVIDNFKVLGTCKELPLPVFSDHIQKPDDDLIFALLLKNLSDRQISLDKKLVNYIIKRIDRSYGKIFDFIYKIDELSLKKKKSIDFKMIKEALGE